MFSESFAGIAPSSVLGFVIAELAAAEAALWVDKMLGTGLAARSQ
jgi:hypothetical protein